MNHPNNNEANETIVLVPGMYSPRLVLWGVARRLRKAGFHTIIVNNRYLLQTPAENAHRLLEKLQVLDTGTVHLLGHSLGGIVILHMLEKNDASETSQQLPDGKIVFMATPVRGSELAGKLYAKRWFRPLLGKSVQQGLLGSAPLALYERPTGVISGSSRRGFCALFYRLAGVNDGVVTQSETELEHACDAACVPQSHALMLFSNEAVDKAAAFFRSGRFV